MEEDDNDDERAIEVRSLDGTSTVVRIPPDRTVADLKTLLKESFPPAKKTPDFILFHKRREPRMMIEHRGFVVLVPFPKRARGCGVPESSSGGSTRLSKGFNQIEASEHADAAWLDMMEDLRSVSGGADDVSPLSNTVVPSASASPRKQNVPPK